MDLEKVKELAKDRGLDIAEESLEALCHLGVDIVKELASETPLALAVFASLEPAAREAIDKIDLDKDGK
jgi:hypothetical protein